METKEIRCEFTYLYSVPYLFSVIIFALLWWMIPMGLIHYKVSLPFMENISSIWVPFYMIAGIMIPSFAFLKFFSGVGEGRIYHDKVVVILNKRSSCFDYADIKAIWYLNSKNIRSLHISLGFVKEKGISELQSNDQSLHQFYLELNKKYSNYKSEKNK